MATASDMRALLLREYGNWRTATIETVPVPVPADNEVLIRTGACALNFPDLLMMEGKYQVKPPVPFVPGRDVAGEIVAVGSNVTGLTVGQRVAAQPPFGAFAEYALAPDWSCLPLPDGVRDIEAAACGTVLATVVGAMRLRAQLKPQEWVLLTGAAGGVGSAGIQYARHLGARVVALVSSAEKAMAARRLGAEIVLRADRISDPKHGLREALRAEGLDAVDAAIDVVGGDMFEGLLRCLRPAGRCVIVGFASGQIPAILANYLLLKDLVVYGSSLDRLFRSRDPDLIEGLHDAFTALANGGISAEIEAVLPLSRFVEAAERIYHRTVVGKLVFAGI
jgi:NADPH:quinone reductase